ncbi:MAG TPA: MopE-related protein [Chitinophagales bacterium]|nr:MopE-related protein [Chitinophagales bacterium]
MNYTLPKARLSLLFALTALFVFNRQILAESYNTVFTYYADTDNDGYGDANNTITSSSSTPPSGYVADNTDCSDNNAAVYPGAQEVCNGYDDDCDGLVDALDPSLDLTTLTLWYYDYDHDGYGTTQSVVFACSEPIGYANNQNDCNDNDASVHAPVTYYADADGDGFGNAGSTVSLCQSTPPSGYVVNNTDCNDNDATVHSPQQYYSDADEDGYGSTTTAVLCSSTAPTGYSTVNTDCSDNDATVHTPQQYYLDADQDGYGSTTTAMFCSSTAPTGYSSNNTDCNDNSASVNPGAAEVCSNGIDDNCNGQVDENCNVFTYYADADGDTYGNPSNSITSSSSVPPSGYVSNNSDCNDANPNVHPGVADNCNGIDDDCNGIVDDHAITATVTPNTPQTICKGSSVTFTANGGSGISYQWKKGSMNISGATHQTYTTNKGSSYSVFETNSYNCSSTSAAVTVTLLQSPSATISYSSLDLCSTGSVTLTANSGAGYTYKWLRSNVLISGATDQTYVATQTGSYKVVVTNSQGCSKTSAGVRVTNSCRNTSGNIASASLSMYPNPSDGIFVIDLSLDDETLNGGADVRLFNMFGQMIYQSRETIANGILLTQVDLTKNLAAGNYFVRVIAGDKVFNSQISLLR